MQSSPGWSRMAGSLLATMLLAGCASAPSVPTAGSSDPSQRAGSPSAESRAAGAENETAFRNRVAETAVSMIGVPYRYGGSTPEGFDCSGLVQYAYDQAGVAVPRTTSEQLAASSSIDWRDAQPADLLFFRTNRKVSHVGIYLGDGRFVHAPSSGRTVEVASLESEYYREHLVRAGRLGLPR